VWAECGCGVSVSVGWRECGCSVSVSVGWRGVSVDVA